MLPVRLFLSVIFAYMLFFGGRMLRLGATAKP